MLVVCRIHCPCVLLLFIARFVADVGCLSHSLSIVHDNIPLESVRNDAVCRSLHFNYPQRLIVVCILPQNETNYTCE